MPEYIVVTRNFASEHGFSVDLLRGSVWTIEKRLDGACNAQRHFTRQIDGRTQDVTYSVYLTDPEVAAHCKTFQNKESARLFAARLQARDDLWHCHRDVVIGALKEFLAPILKYLNQNKKGGN